MIITCSVINCVNFYRHQKLAMDNNFSVNMSNLLATFSVLHKKGFRFFFIYLAGWLHFCSQIQRNIIKESHKMQCNAIHLIWLHFRMRSVDVGEKWIMHWLYFKPTDPDSIIMRISVQQICKIYSLQNEWKLTVINEMK